MNKRGQFYEVAFIGSLLFIAFFGAILMTYLMGLFSDFFSAQTYGNASKDLIDTGLNNYKTVIDGSALILAGLLLVGVVALAFILPTHPIFIVIGIIGLFFLVPYAGLVKDIYFYATNETILNSTAVQFTNANTVMSNLPMFLLIADILFIVAMFTKGFVGL